MGKMSDLAIDQEIEKRAELDRKWQERIDSGEIVEPIEKEPTCRFGHMCTSDCQMTVDCPCLNDHCCALSEDVCDGTCDDCFFKDKYEAREEKALLASKDFFKTANRDALKGLDMRTSMEAQEDERLNPLDL